MIQQSWAYIRRKTEKIPCTPMFTEAPFTIGKIWKEPKCPSTDEWIKMWYIYTMEYYSAIKRNEIVPLAQTWMDLEAVTESQSERENQVSYINTYIWNLEK